MTKLIGDLNAIGDCVCVARIDATCDRWHLEERVVPSLLALSDKNDEPRLRQAAEAAVVASKHFEAAQHALRSATRLIEECAPPRPSLPVNRPKEQASDTESGSTRRVEVYPDGA